MADVTDWDASGADITLDSVNLDPSGGVKRVGEVVRAIPTAAQEVGTDVSEPIVTPVSTSVMPRGAETRPIAPNPGQPVDLSPPNPAKLAQAKPAWSPFDKNPVYDPDANQLDYAEAVAKKQARDAAARASGPIMKFLDNTWSNNQAEEARTKALEVQRVQNLRQQQKDMQSKADNMGMPRGDQTWSQTNDTLVENTLKRYRTGAGGTEDQINAQDALIARGHKDLVDAYRSDAITAMETRKSQGQQVLNSLDAAKTDLDYKKKAEELSDPKHPMHHPDFDIPGTRGEWEAQRGKREESMRRATVLLNNYRQQRANQTDYTNQTDEKQAKIQTESTKMYNGEVMPSTTAKVHLGNGSIGTAGPYGSNDFRMLGNNTHPDGWNTATGAVRKSLTEEGDAAYPKVEREKGINLARALKLATTDPKTGLPMTDEKSLHLINTNPSVQQVLVEGITAAARGGAGGTNGQLIKLELAKRGKVQAALDDLITSWAGGKGVLTGKEGQYLSKFTQSQMRYVIDFLKDYNDKDVSKRLGAVAERAGMHGINLKELGYEEEISDATQKRSDFGRDKQKYYLSSLPRIVRDHDSVFLEPGKSSEGVPGMTNEKLPLSALPGLSYDPTIVAPPPPTTGGGTVVAPPGGGPVVPGGGPVRVIPGPTGGPAAGGSPSTPPPPLRGNAVASTVYTSAGQTALNVGGGNPTIGGNVAKIAASSAQSESSFNPNAPHDPGPDGKPIGYGLFGHQKERLTAMHKFAGTSPGQPIPPATQSAFYAREMLEAAKSDPFIAATLSNPNASAEDLTRVQMRMEKPEGYVKGQEERAPSWNARLRNTTALMEGGQVQPASVPYPNPKSREEAAANYRAGLRSTPEEAAQSARLRQQRLDSATQSAAHLAPAAGALIGGVAGSVIPGVGTAAGATGGGVLGGLIEHGFTAPQEQQNARGFTEAGVFGGAKGAASAVGGLGIGGTAARVAANTAVPVIEKWWKGGEADEIFDAGMKGMAEGMFGEAFGRGLGLGHQIWGSLSTVGKSELLATAKILATQEPKIAGAGGKMIDNPVWLKAEARAKELHQDPDTLAYNYNQTVKVHGEGKTPATMGEVVTNRPSAVEAAKTGRENYDPIRTQIQDAPKPKGVSPFKDGPTTIVGPGKAVPEKFRADAETAEGTMLTGTTGKAPKTWGETWENHADARTALLDKEREALAAAPHAGQKEAVKAYRALADQVRVQQERIATKLLPPDQAKSLIQQLETADIRYKRAMTAGGPDIVATIAKGGPKGREAKDAFDALVGNDPQAKRMMQSLVNLHVSSAKQAGKQAVTGLGALGSAAALLHFVPGVGTVAASAIVAAKGTQVIRDLMVQRGAAKTATFNKLVEKQLSNEARARYVQGSSAMAGPAASQGVNMMNDEAAPAPAASP